VYIIGVKNSVVGNCNNSVQFQGFLPFRPPKTVFGLMMIPRIRDEPVFCHVEKIAAASERRGASHALSAALLLRLRIRTQQLQLQRGRPSLGWGMAEGARPWPTLESWQILAMKPATCDEESLPPCNASDFAASEEPITEPLHVAVQDLR
jgi:hypothetical protein